MAFRGASPISADATYKALTQGQTVAADAAQLSEERLELDAQELRDLERSELYPTSDPPPPESAPKTFWRRLLRR
jgi:hypothetical protein